MVGDHLSMGTEFLGTICPWGQNWLGTVCPEGPNNWGLIVGDQMSGDHICLGPNVSQPGLAYEKILNLQKTKNTFLLRNLKSRKKKIRKVITSCIAKF